MQRGLNLVRSGAGFSLIEVMAVVAIIMLVFVLYWGPTTGNNAQRQARKDCQNQLQRISAGITATTVRFSRLRE